MATKIERVKRLADALLTVGTGEDIDVVLMAHVEAAVRLLRAAKGIDSAEACGDLVQIVQDIGLAERVS